MISFKKRFIEEEDEDCSDSARMKKSTNSQTMLIDELNQQLSRFSILSQEEKVISPEKIVGMFYQNLAAEGALGKVKKIECIYDERLDAHKGWALGMAVAEKQIPVVMHILRNPGKMIHRGHIKYAIQKARETNQVEIEQLLSDFNQTVSGMEVDQRKFSPT